MPEYGLTEVLVIGIIAILLFGNRLPRLIRWIGKGVVAFKNRLNDVRDRSI